MDNSKNNALLHVFFNLNIHILPKYCRNMLASFHSVSYSCVSQPPLAPSLLLTSQVTFHSVNAGTVLPLPIHLFIIFLLYSTLRPLPPSLSCKLLASQLSNLAQFPWTLMLHISFTHYS